MVARDKVVRGGVGLSDCGNGQNEGEVTKECEGDLARLGSEHGGVVRKGNGLLRRQAMVSNAEHGECRGRGEKTQGPAR